MILGAALVFGSALLVAAAPASASERSERLVASGEVAYGDGRWDDARAAFADAVAADPGDPVAHYQLGLALAKLGRWDDAADAFDRARALRPGFEEAERALAIARTQASEAAERTAAAKRWEIRATTGVQYDSNVKVAPGGRVVLAGGRAVDSGDRDDVAFLLGAGGRYDVVRRPDTLVRLEYDLYQTLHPDLGDFDFRSHRLRGVASRQLTHGLWVGLQAGYDHYTLGTSGYESEPYVMPFLSLLQGDRGLTQLTYRHGEASYLSSPFDDTFDRDGPNDAVGASQTINFGPRAISAGYLYAEERPKSPRGADYRFASHQGYVGVSFPAWWQTDVDLVYLLRYDGYTEPNSEAGFRKHRHDLAHEVSADIGRAITDHVRASIVYYGTWNGSNIALFDYDRQIVSAVLQVTY